MAAGQGAQDYIELTDFTPGIYSNYLSAGGAQASADGTAQKTDTWGCYGSPSGGLLPLPKLVATRDRTIDTGSEGTTYPTGFKRYQVLDTVNLTPTVSYTGAEDVDFAYSGEPDFLFHVNQRYRDSGAAASYNRIMEVIGTKFFPSGGVAEIQVDVHDASYTPELHSSRRLYGHGSLDVASLRYNNLVANALNPCLLFLINNVTNNVAHRRVGIFPPVPNAVVTTDTVAHFLDADEGNPRIILSHQGRIVTSGLFSLGVGLYGPRLGASGEMPAHEAVDFWQPGLTTTASKETATTPAQYGQENYSGWGSWISGNNSELLIIKQAGGGVVVRGDLARPTVVALPSLPSTHEAVNKGAMTEKGYVYGTREGVWLWSGGDEAELISPQLEGWFWKVDNGGWDQHYISSLKGKFAYVHPYLLAPNNYVMDIRTGGWFRLSLPAENRYYAFYDISASGRFYATPAYYAADPSDHVHDRFDPAQGTSLYKWRSQPLARTRNRVLNFREINVIVQGFGTLQVELLGITGVTATHTFTFNSTSRPVALQQYIKLQAHDVEVRITSTGDSGGTAPSLYRCSLGFTETMSV